MLLLGYAISLVGELTRIGDADMGCAKMKHAFQDLGLPCPSRLESRAAPQSSVISPSMLGEHYRVRRRSLP